jgi:hypothetical protein
MKELFTQIGPDMVVNANGYGDLRLRVFRPSRKTDTPNVIAFLRAENALHLGEQGLTLLGQAMCNSGRKKNPLTGSFSIACLNEDNVNGSFGHIPVWSRERSYTRLFARTARHSARYDVKPWRRRRTDLFLCITAVVMSK